MSHFGYLIWFTSSLCGTIIFFPFLVAARFCEGGHHCSPPKECCPQGCCYLYAPPSVPRSLPPATDHVLNLFFINHWYFWCLVVAIILAILCACSLWKKRRQLCGWGSPDHHTQSEGDSAGSCYAPPQYSRCSSFHHPPPPYTEVTSKPDLYPLVFTCNGESGKTGASYLMVQYFRNYIVRPAGSLSATSTADSLSSSFICTANEANTLVPPPYSRAASPDNPLNSNYQQHFMIPRSASQLVCSQDVIQSHTRNNNPSSNITNNRNSINISQQQNSTVSGTQLRQSESVNFQNIRLTNDGEHSNVIGSQSDQQFRYISSSNNNLSDIFTNYNNNNNNLNNTNNNHNNNTNNSNSGISETGSNPGNQMQANNNLIYNKNSTNQFTNSNNPLYNSCGSIGGISITVPVVTDGDSEYRDLDVLRRSLETCCQILQQQQMPSVSFNSEDSPINTDIAKKYDGIRSYVTSTTSTAVSSLANIGSPSSPPQATSPTGEVKELLEQIRQFNTDNNVDTQIIQQPLIETAKTNKIHVAPTRRPSTLQQSKKKFFLNKPNKAMYIPINNTNVKTIRSPVGGTSFLAYSRGRRGWISRSAPTTPGTTLPPSRLGDDSPLLNEHDEDAEQNT